MGSFKVITINGKSDFPVNWAASNISGKGVTVRLINDRLRKGWSSEDAVKLPVKLSGARARPSDVNLYPYKGKLMSASEISRLTGKTVSAVRSKGSRAGDVVKPNTEYADKIKALSAKGVIKDSAASHYMSNLIKSGLTPEDVSRRVRSFINSTL